MANFASNNVTRLLQEMEAGSKHAGSELLQAIYSELRTVAAREMNHIAVGETLQPTALVNEAYLRLVGKGQTDWKSRRHFFFVAARAMRDILIEEARRKATRKRGGDWKRADASQLQLAIESPADDLLALDEALERLEKDDPRKAQIVQLRFFAGLNEEETASALGVHARTIRREWKYIRVRLFEELSTDTGETQ